MAEVIVLDLETQYMAFEVGGWKNISALQVAVAVTWDEDHEYRTWWEAQVGDLLEELDDCKLIVGYNISVFDLEVLSLYGHVEHLKEKVFDVLDELFQQTHFRLGLGVVAMLNLGEAKAMESGADAIKLWRDGRVEDLEAYCLKDVELTKRLFEMWRDTGILWATPERYVIWPGRRWDDEEEEE